VVVSKSATAIVKNRRNVTLIASASAPTATGQSQRDAEVAVARAAIQQYRKAVDTAADSFSAQAEAKRYLKQACKERSIPWPSQ